MDYDEIDRLMMMRADVAYLARFMANNSLQGDPPDYCLSNRQVLGWIDRHPKGFRWLLERIKTYPERYSIVAVLDAETCDPKEEQPCS